MGGRFLGEEPCGRSDDWFAHNGTVSQFGQLCWETSGWEWGWLNWVAIHLLSLLNCRQEAITTIWERIDGGSFRLFANRIETIFCWRKHEIAVNVLNKCAIQHFNSFGSKGRRTWIVCLEFQEPSQRVVVGVFFFWRHCNEKDTEIDWKHKEHPGQRHHTFIYREHSAQNNGQKGINKRSTKSNATIKDFFLFIASLRLFSGFALHCPCRMLFVQFNFLLTKGGIIVLICRQVNFVEDKRIVQLLCKLAEEDRWRTRKGVSVLENKFNRRRKVSFVYIIN